MERATCWSITINNPKEDEYNCSLPAKWMLSGQLEKGEEEGTVHYQGMLTTPQVRFSAVKKQFPRAHIEVAKNRSALSKYVHKDDTRLQVVQDNVSNIPTLFDYQHTVASKWNEEDFVKMRNGIISQEPNKCEGDIALLYIDSIVEQDIIDGVLGIEYIAINPMWRSSWKKFYRGIILREKKIRAECIENGETVRSNFSSSEQGTQASSSQQDNEGS